MACHATPAARAPHEGRSDPGGPDRPMAPGGVPCDAATMQRHLRGFRAPRIRGHLRRSGRIALVGALAVAVAAPTALAAPASTRTPATDTVAARAGDRTGPAARPLRTLPTSLLVTLRAGKDPTAVDAAAAPLGLIRVAWNPDARTAQYVAVTPGDSATPGGETAGMPAAVELTPAAAAIRAAARVDGRERARLARLGAELRRVPGVQAAAVPVELELLEDPPAEPSPDPTPTPTPAPTPPLPVGPPNDEFWYAQWGPDAIGARGAWALTRGRTEIVVAVVDSGVDLGHPDLKGRLIPGIDVGSGDSDPTDESDSGHGTHVTGIIAAASGNGIGVSGAAPRVVVMPVKVANNAGSIWDTAVAEGITWAVSRGARVVNLSLGGTKASAAVNAAIDAARAKGVVVVAAAGNGGIATVSQPAAHAPSVAVAALTDTQVGPPGSAGRYVQATYSNYGPQVDIAAPGTQIASTIPRRFGSYAYMQGTSMATPFVAAAAALVLSRNPSLTADQVEAALTGTALDLGTPGSDPETGAGLLRADLAAWSVATPVADGVAPTVAIAGITDGTRVRNTKTLSFAAADASPIVALRVYRDGTYLRVRRAASHSFSWNSNGVKDGLHRWTAYGTDTGLAVGSRTVTVLVANDRAVRALRASRTMTATDRSLNRTIRLGRKSPLVARFTAPSGTTVRLRVINANGKVLADVRGTGAAAVALTGLKAGRYTLRASAATATPGAVDPSPRRLVPLSR